MVILRFLLLFLLFYSQNHIIGQGTILPNSENNSIKCGAIPADIVQAKIAESTLLIQKQIDQAFTNRGQSDNNISPISIPVVIHIIHDNGDENISDGQVNQALSYLNEAFQNSGYYQTAQGVESQIYFCLAEQDPNGLQTTGIKRTRSGLTNLTVENEDLALKNLSRWPSESYINIWVVNSINSLSIGDGISGYALPPSAQGTALDGLVCEANYFGTTAQKTAVLIHEMGHYLGLYHTFKGGCQNDDCTTQGDLICDTPPDQAQHTICPYNSCDTDADAPSPNPFTTDVDDPTENFMDYSPLFCYRSFTNGQAERMQWILENIRTSLATSLGCDRPCTQPIVADFEFETGSDIILGTPTVIRNKTVGASKFIWSNNNVPFSVDSIVTHTFTEEGHINIRLLAFNTYTLCADTVEKEADVYCAISPTFTTAQGPFHVGDTIFIQNTTANAYTYIWEMDGDTVSQLQNPFFVFQSPGNHIITLFASNYFCQKNSSQSFNILPACQGVICPEICNNGIDDDQNGFVDCYDSACDCFSDIDCTVPALTNNFSMQLAWQSQQNGAAVNAVPMVANLDPHLDSLPEIVVMASPEQVASGPGHEVLIFRGDGSNAGLPSILPILRGFDCYPMTHPTIADVDGDGSPELIIVEYDGLVRVYRHFDASKTPCMDLWITSDEPAWSRNARPTLADFNEDGTPEIYTGNTIFQFDFSDPSQAKLLLRLTSNGPAGQVLYRNFEEDATVSVGMDLLTPAECSGDPDCNGLELIAGPVMYSVDLDDQDGDGFELKIQRDLNAIEPSADWKDGYTAVADMDLDGTADVVVSSGKDDRYGLYFWNKRGLLAFLPYETESFLSGSIPCIANIYDDRKGGFAQDFPEVIACSHKKLSCFNLNAATQNILPFWWQLNTTDASGLTGSSVFDFNGDGFSEIVYRDEEHLRILYGGALPFPNGVDADRNWFRFETGSGTFDEYPVVADVDADGEAEIAVTGFTTSGQNSPITDYRGRLRIFESGSAPWVPARSVWNQFNYFIIHIQDDLKIPSHQQSHWVEMPFTGTENRPFNGHLAQLPVLDASFLPFYPVPDGALSVDSIFCKNANLYFTLNITNRGSATLPKGTPLQWYDTDPQTTAANTLGTTWLLPEPIEVDSTASYIFDIPLSGNVLRYAVLNDSGTLATPFDLALAFPNTNLPECDFSNNIIELKFDYTPISLDLGGDLNLCSSSVVTLSSNTTAQKYRWSDGQNAPSITASAPSLVWLDVWDYCGFHASDSVLLSLESVGDLNLPEQVNVCTGDPFSLEVVGFDRVQWQPSQALTCSDCPSVSLLQNTSITLYVTGQNGNCFASDSVEVIFSPSPVLSLLADSLDCQDHLEATLSASAVDGNAPYEFLWSSGEINAEITTDIPGDYTVILTDAIGCTATAIHTLANPPVLDFLINEKHVPCFGGKGGVTMEVLEGIEPINYLWSTGATSRNLLEVQAGNYNIQAIDAQNCSFYDTIQLLEPEELQLDFQADTLNCLKTTGDIQALPSGGTAPYSLQWLHGPSSTYLGDLEQGIYTLSIQDSNQCFVQNSVSFFLDTLAPVFAFQNDSLAIPCNADMIELTADVLNFDINLIETAWRNRQGDSTFWINNSTTIDAKERGWYAFSIKTSTNFCEARDSIYVFPAKRIQDVFGKAYDVSCFGENNGVFHIQGVLGGKSPFLYGFDENSLGSDAIFANLNAGYYPYLIEDRYGCRLESAFEIEEPNPFWVDLYAEKIELNKGASLRLRASISPPGHPIRSQLWSPPNLFQNQSELEPLIFPLDTTHITFQVIDTSGCIAQERLFIQVNHTDVYAPNIIAAESFEDGIFTLYSARDVREILDLKIFNRWGGIIFQQQQFPPNAEAFGWDGKQDGKTVQNGVYIWKADIRLSNGSIQTLRGDITVINR